MAESESGSRQFALARGSITMIKRAYPQFMAAGGDQLPREILTTIFPLKYWDLIRKYSAQHKLDPYLIAALVAQESTFVPDIKSHAGAYGLMQMMPPTGRQYARKMKLRYSLGLLTTAESNVRMGTAYFADKVREFGSVHAALASYNAGETPVWRWLRESPNLPQEEFIDDIPYPETQHYVKRILGTAEDYRRLYAEPGRGTG
jgi:soluble lytic murein transglycosylase